MSPRARHLWLLALAALALRAPLLLLSPGAEYDITSYAHAAGIGGPGLYSAAETAGRYPYLPLWWLLLKGLKALAELLGGNFGLWSRLPGVAGDVAVSALLYLLVERRSRSSAALSAGPDAPRSASAGLIAGLGWALNPVAALISASHGQFDSLALALLLGAAWQLEYADDPRAELWAALCLAAAVALKTWPLAFLPLYLSVFPSGRERLRFVALVLLPPLLLLAPWLLMDGPLNVVSRIGYSGATALGFSGALRAAFFAVDAPVALYRQADDLWRSLSLGLLAAAFVWGLLQPRRLRLLDGLAWVALTLLLLAPGFSPQYLGWPIALALLRPGGPAWRLTFAGLPLLVAFYALFMPPVLAGAAAWAPPHVPPMFYLLWAAANLGWCFFAAVEWARLMRLNLAPRRDHVFR